MFAAGIVLRLGNRMANAISRVPWLRALFNPAKDVFDPGTDKGGVLNPGSSDDVRQNPDGTGAVAPGGKVGWVKNTLEGGSPATQSDTTKQPRLRDSGKGLDFDLDDELIMPITGSRTTGTVVVGRPSGVETQENVDLSSGSYTIKGDFYSLTVIDRALVEEEKTQTETWTAETIPPDILPPEDIQAFYVPVFAPRNVQVAEV